MKRLLLCIVIGAVLGCDMPRHLRYAESNASSVIGIALNVKLYNALLKEQTTVYFVKLDEKDKNNLGTKIIPCNYYRGYMVSEYYAYLVNAEPGTYAAVCSTKYETFATDAITASKATEVGYITMFDSNIIKNSITEVGPGQIAFMGSFSIESKIKSVYMNIEKNGDQAQQHYYSQLKPFLEGTYFLGALVKADRSNRSTRQFLVTTKEFFRNSDWLKMITNAITAFDKAVEGQSL